MFDELLKEIPVLLAVWALPLLVAGIIFYGRKLGSAIGEEIALRIGDRQWSLLQDLAFRAVQAAEQITGIDTNEDKKRFALNTLDDLCRMFSIPVSRETLDVVIEGVLKMAKAEMDPTLPVTTLEINEF